MSVRRVNGTTPTISRRKSNPENKKLIKINPKAIQHQKTINKNSNILSKKRDLKVDYNSSNYIYNDDEDEYYEAYPYDKINYYEKTQSNSRYNSGANDANDNYITVEHEDGHIKYIQKNYVEFKPIYKNKNVEYYEDDNSENNYTGNENINFEDEYAPAPEIKSKQFQKLNNYYLTQNNSGVRKFKKNANQNIVNQAENHQNNYKKDIKRNTRLPDDSLQNYGNNITTTNNTYNNNIYYISPINVKNKSKNKNSISNNKKSVRKSTHNLSKKNSISKNIDITLNSKTPHKERDYFRMNNITDKALKQKYINSIILIQSVYRSYLVKIKLYNNISLYIHCKKVIGVLEMMILERKMFFWKLFKEYTPYKFYDNIISSKINLNELKKLLDNKSYSKEKPKLNSLHKELGDSFNIIINNTQKENTEKKLKSKLNDVIKENTELKNQLVDNKNIEEKMKNLMDENMKNKSINDIIIKDNQQLAKKLKDIQDYRKIRLIIENTQSIDLTQKQKIQIEELVNTNDLYLNKLKKICLKKIIHNKMSKNEKLLKDKFNKYRKVVQKIKNEELLLKALFNKIRNNLKIKKQKYFLYLINNIKEINFKKQLQTKCFENVINNTSKNMQISLYKNYFKFFSKIMKCETEEKIKETERLNKEETKQLLLKSIFRKCSKKKKFLLKIFFEKWYLKSVIISMREAARDKKKKRKLKRKTNKLLYQKQFGYTEKPPNYYKNNPEIIHIVSNGTISLSNQAGNNAKKNKMSTSSDKVIKKNNLEEKNNRVIKKNNSINEIKNSDNKDDNKENINCNEDSDEDSGDSFELDNPSDKEC